MSVKIWLFTGLGLIHSPNPEYNGAPVVLAQQHKLQSSSSGGLNYNTTLPRLERNEKDAVDDRNLFPVCTGLVFARKAQTQRTGYSR